MTLEIVPVTLKQAAGFVAEHHRHNKPPRGHKFSIGVQDADGRLVGVVMVGRPVARSWDDGRTAEVSRSCTDGTTNANSRLYGAAWRAARAMGYRRAVTYTQAGETGASLRAAGWFELARRRARGSWADHTADERLKTMRDQAGAGGVERIAWGQGDWA